MGDKNSATSKSARPASNESSGKSKGVTPGRSLSLGKFAVPQRNLGSSESRVSDTSNYAEVHEQGKSVMVEKSFPAPSTSSQAPTTEERKRSIDKSRKPREVKGMTPSAFIVKKHQKPPGNFVKALKQVFGSKFVKMHDGTAKHNKSDKLHKTKSQIELDGFDILETPIPTFRIKQTEADELEMKLYGDQGEALETFLKARRECERELVFEEASFPRWVTYVWKVHLLYEMCSSIFLIVSVFFGMYSGIFRNHSQDSQLMGILSIIVAVDVTLRLLVELWRSVTKCGYEVFTVKYTFFLALMDLIALFPYTQLRMYRNAHTGADLTIEDLNHMGGGEFIRIFHVFRMTKILDILQNDMNVRGPAKFLVALLRYITQYLFVVHFLSCVLFWIGKRTYLDWLLNRSPETESDVEFVTFLSLRKRLATPPAKYFLPYPESFGLYTLSCYLVVGTITTVGYGDFFPVNNYERVLVILMMMIGCIWISGKLAYQLGTFFSDLDASRYLMEYRLNCINIHLKNYQISNFICTRTLEYYRHLWRYRKGVHEIDLGYLPHSVQGELKFDICEEMFYKSPMFRGLDETFLMGLARKAKVALYCPRMILFERGNITKQMCFILQGECAVAAGLEDDHISAIHRAGCIIGEINLFMGIPYEQCVYTNTVCTIMTITKKDLMLTLQDFPHIFSIMRDRIKARRASYRRAFTLVQAHPYVQWIYPKTASSLKCDPLFPVLINRMHGWNREVTGYPSEDEQIIIEMPCFRADLSRVEAHTYRLVSVPQIYYDPGFWLTLFNMVMLFIWVANCWIIPACATFDDFEDATFELCMTFSEYWGILLAISAVDFLAELVMACPATGLYYKIRDGIEVRKASIEFYLDLLAMLPYELVFVSWLSPIIRGSLKLLKIGRIWDFLDERFALKLFYIRILKLTYYLIYLTYIICIMYLNLACEHGRLKPCTEISFYNPKWPYSRLTRLKDDQSFEKHIFTTPLALSASSITSAGFSNIFPQTGKEILATIVFMIIGHFFVSYILAQLTSALSARLTPKLIFHQKLVVVKTFVRHNGLSTKLFQKLVEHYDLQHQYYSGCALPKSTHLMYDGHKVLLEDLFLVEGELFFDGVPAFSKIPAQAIIDMSRLMQRFVVPPDLVFVQRGEVRRTLYIIVNGAVALYQHAEKSASAILTSTGHFGLRDLLFGEPYPYKVKTLSYVVLYAVDYSVYKQVLGDDEGLMDYIKDEILRRQDEIKTYLYANIVDEDGPSRRDVNPPSWIRYPPDPDTPLLGSDLTYDHFEKPFLYYRGSNFIREKTMYQTLHPAGLFGKVWQAVMGLAAVATVMSLIVETFMGFRGPNLRYVQFALDLLFCADVYMRCHFAYYSYSGGEMRYHPVKTWMRYMFHGTFFIDVAMCIPLELIITFSGSTDKFGYGLGHPWFTKLRWIRLLRCYKFIELYNIVHRIFEARTAVMFFFYLSICVLMATSLAAVAFNIACPTLGYLWEEGDEEKMPVCIRGTWPETKGEDMLDHRRRYIRDRKGMPEFSFAADSVFYPRGFLERWVLGLYYVGQVLMVIGFGDLATFRKNELHFLIIVALFGFIICQAIISDITSAQIDTDEVRAKNREKLERLAIALSRENTRHSFTKYVGMAFRLSWSYAKGLQPNVLFEDLHPVLHRELLSEYIGDAFDRAPIILGFTDAFVNALKMKLKIEFYPKGGLITRAGDLEYRMYVVALGDLWVCDRDNRWICTMSTGESIGEMSLVYASKRRFNAYAATNLKLLVLNAVDFAAALENFPLTRKDIVKSLIDYKRESYIVKTWKWKSRDPDGYRAELEKNTELLQNFRKSDFSKIPVSGRVRLKDDEKCPPEPGFFRTLVGYGNSDIIIHYLYFASDNGNFNLCIHPSCGFMSHFRFLVQTARFFGAMIALFHIFFYVDSVIDVNVTKYTTLFSWMFDVIMWAKILANFFTAVEITGRRTYCKNLKKIFIHYIFGPQRFLFDLLVVFPYGKITGRKGTKLLFFRCLLIVKFFMELAKLGDGIETSTLQLKLLTSMSVFVGAAHILACLFFVISCPEFRKGINKCDPSGWVARFRIEYGKTVGPGSGKMKLDLAGNEVPLDEDDLLYPYMDNRPSHWYVISLYWVMAVVTTCGFGEITPMNFEEMSLAVFTIFFGSLFLSIVLGNITTGLSSMNEAKRLYLGSVEKMLDYLQVIGLSTVGHQTLSAYCNTTWNNCRGVNYNDIADILPLYVQQDVYVALYHNSFTNCLFFGADYGLSFVRAACTRLRHYMFLPGMRIVNELEPGAGIYIIKSGAVTSFQQNPETGNHEFIKRYEINQVFGRLPALYPGALYNKSYRAEEKTEVLLMYHADMRQLIMKYPRWRIFIKQLIAREYRYFGKVTSLKNITEPHFDLDERLTKDLTYEQFTECANMFASEPPERKGKVNAAERDHNRKMNARAQRKSTQPPQSSKSKALQKKARSASVSLARLQSSQSITSRRLSGNAMDNVSLSSSQAGHTLPDIDLQDIIRHGHPRKSKSTTMIVRSEPDLRQSQ